LSASARSWSPRSRSPPVVVAPAAPAARPPGRPAPPAALSAKPGHAGRPAPAAALSAKPGHAGRPAVPAPPAALSAKPGHAGRPPPTLAPERAADLGGTAHPDPAAPGQTQDRRLLPSSEVLLRVPS